MRFGRTARRATNVETLEQRMLLANSSAGWLYGVDSGADDGSCTLIKIDPNSGALLRVGETGFSQVYDIALLADGRLFGVTSTQLIQIDPNTGAGTPVGGGLGFTGANALDVGPDGTLFAASRSGNFFSINMSTGDGVPIGSFGNGLSSSGDIVFARDGKLYGIADSGFNTGELIEINSTNGAATIIGDTGFDSVFGLAFAADGRLYGTANGDAFSTPTLIGIDLSSGHATAVSEISGANGMNGLTRAQDAAPTVRSLIAIPDPVPRGAHFTLRAMNVGDDASVASVRFYKDANRNGRWDKRDAVVSTRRQIGGKNWSSDALPSSALRPGKYVYFARAMDAAGHMSTARSAVVVVTSPTLKITEDLTRAAGLAHARSSVRQAAPLQANLIVYNDLKLWLTARATSSNGQIKAGGGTGGIFAKRGLISPEGNASYLASFSGAGDRATVSLAFDSHSLLLNIADFALPPIGLIPPEDLAAIVNDLGDLPAFQKAVADLTPTPASPLAWATALGKVALDLRKLASDKTQNALLRSVLAKVGVKVSKDQIEKLFTVKTIYDLLRKLADEIVLFVQTKGDAMEVSFVAEPDV